MVAEHHHRALDRWAGRQGGGVLLFSRLVPVISFNLINYAAGLTALSWWTFTWATGLGILPLTFLMVAIGDGLGSGAGELWPWLLAAAAAGWLSWWALVVRRRDKDEGRAAEQVPASSSPPRGSGHLQTTASGDRAPLASRRRKSS
jgi:uncharacterized membrane protein YdjX (TVP38/TMEM64 family)